MKILKTLHLASFDGNIGDSANHFGFYKYLKENKDFSFEIDKLEIREFYWKERFFDESFVYLVNAYDLLIIGGANFFELWVEDSPTGTSIAIELNLLEQINTPIIFNAVAVDPGQGASKKNIKKFQNFLNMLIKRNDLISIRNDGSKQAILDYVGKEYLNHIIRTPDAGFFIDINKTNAYYKDKKYMAVNIAYDMLEVRFDENENKLSYENFLETFKLFITDFLIKYNDFEIVLVPHIFRDITFINDLLLGLDDNIRRKKISVAPLLHGEDSFKEVMGIYKDAKLVLANRFHANVCSIGLGAVTIGLINYRQIKDFYKEIKSKNFVDIQQQGFGKELLELISNIDMDKIEKDFSIKDDMHKYYQEYHDKIERYIKNNV